MNHETARAGIDALFIGQLGGAEELRAHLDGCDECRAYFDVTAHTFRALTGKPDEMTEAELAFFAPPLPAMPVTRLRNAPLLGGLLALAAAVTLVVWLRPSEFGARGTETPPAAQTSVRALCSHDVEDAGVVVRESCQDGDRLGFVAKAGSKRFIAVVLVDGASTEVLISGTDGALHGDEEVLSAAASWHSGARVVTVFADAPISADVARACVEGACELERRELPR